MFWLVPQYNALVNLRERVTWGVGRVLGKVVRLEVEPDMAARERYWQEVRRLSELRNKLSSEAPQSYEESLTDSQALHAADQELARIAFQEPRRRVTVVLFDRKPVIEMSIPLSQ